MVSTWLAALQISNLVVNIIMVWKVVRAPPHRLLCERPRPAALTHILFSKGVAMFTDLDSVKFGFTEGYRLMLNGCIPVSHCKSSQAAIHPYPDGSFPAAADPLPEAGAKYDQGNADQRSEDGSPHLVGRPVPGLTQAAQETEILPRLVLVGGIIEAKSGIRQLLPECRPDLRDLLWREALAAFHKSRKDARLVLSVLFQQFDALGIRQTAPTECVRHGVAPGQYV